MAGGRDVDQHASRSHGAGPGPVPAPDALDPGQGGEGQALRAQRKTDASRVAQDARRAVDVERLLDERREGHAFDLEAGEGGEDGLAQAKVPRHIRDAAHAG